MKTRIYIPTLKNTISSMWFCLPAIFISAALLSAFVFPTLGSVWSGGFVGLILLCLINSLGCFRAFTFNQKAINLVVKKMLVFVLPILLIGILSLISNGFVFSDTIDFGRVFLVVVAPWMFKSLVFTQEEENRFIYLYTKMVTAVGLMLIVMWLFHFFPEQTRLEFLGMHKQRAGALLTAMLVVTLCSKNKSKFDVIVTTLGCLSTLTLTLASNSQLAQLSSTLIVCVFFIQKTGVSFRLAPKVIVLFTFFIALMIPFTVFFAIEHGFQEQFRELTTGRTNIWYTTLSAWHQSPYLQMLIGNGPSSGDVGLYFGRTEHNIFIAMLYRLGIFGVIAYTWWIWSLARSYGANSSKIHLQITLSILVMCLQALFTTTIPFGLALGYVLLIPLLATGISKD